MSTERATKYVYDFAEGDKDQRDLLGGKGANLAEMTNLGLPVPPGFTISTDACRAYLERGDLPDGLDAEVSEHLDALDGPPLTDEELAAIDQDAVDSGINLWAGSSED